MASAVLLVLAGCTVMRDAAAPQTPTPVQAAVRAMRDCVIERHVQTFEGHRLVLWIMRPPGEGPFPVLVWNHGSRTPAQTWLGNRIADPTIDFDTPCRSEITRERWMMVFPEGRGYGGSEGPSLAAIEPGSPEVVEYLAGRGRDANAAAELVGLRPDAKRHCKAIGGVSHGGATALFAAAAAPKLYRAVVLQATGICYFLPCQLESLEHAAEAIEPPLLIQHFQTDSRVPIAVSRRIAARAAFHNKEVTLREYPGVPGEEGHEVNAPGNYRQWSEDYRHALRQAFAKCEPTRIQIPVVPLLPERRRLVQ